MSRGVSGFRNWKYRHVSRFLKDQGFYLCKQGGGSAEVWFHEQMETIIHVHRLHGRDFYTQNEIISMVSQSKLGKKEWRRWADS